MAKSYEVLNFLIPNGGYIQVGEEYEGITFLQCEPISKEEYQAGFGQFDAWKVQQQAEAEAKKQALLDRLGISAEEARLLLSQHNPPRLFRYGKPHFSQRIVLLAQDLLGLRQQGQLFRALASLELQINQFLITLIQKFNLTANCMTQMLITTIAPITLA